MVRAAKVRETRGDRTFLGVIYALLLLILILYVYPMYFVVIASISDPNAVWNGQVTLYPAGFSLEGYEYLLAYREIWIGYLNTIFYTAGGLFFNLTMTMTAAYALSRREFMLRGAIMKLVLFTMFFSGGLIPEYLLIQGLHLLDTRWVLLISGAVSAYNLFIARTYLLNSIPEELHEAAFIDGCSETKYFLRIALPLSGALLGVLSLYYGASHWNAYFGAMIWIKDRSKYPLQLILREILNVATSSSLYEGGGSEAEMARLMRIAEVTKYCAIIVASVPAIIAYPFVQKSFVKGVMVGSIKG